MEVAKLGLIFCIIVVIIWLKYPLYLAMTAFPDEGLPFLAMLMGAVWAAMELSPTHVCAFVAATTTRPSPTLWQRPCPRVPASM